MRRNPIYRAAGLLFGYIAFSWAVRLVFLTFIAYTFVGHQDQGAGGNLQKIGDIARANQSLTYGIAAFLFIVLLQIMHPLTQTRFREVFDMKTLKLYFAPNALNGLILTSVLILGSALGGHMSFLGIYMRFDEVMMTIVSVLVFGTSLILLAIVEEFIFRKVIEPLAIAEWGFSRAMILSCVLFVGLKWFQFNLEPIQVINLVLWNLTLSMIARGEKNFLASASFSGTSLFLTHAFFGLPYMGQDMPGILLLRATSNEGLGNLLSGGLEGPEAGIVLTVLLVIYLYLPQIRSKKLEV